MNQFQFGLFHKQVQFGHYSFQSYFLTLETQNLANEKLALEVHGISRRSAKLECAPSHTLLCSYPSPTLAITRTILSSGSWSSHSSSYCVDGLDCLISSLEWYFSFRDRFQEFSFGLAQVATLCKRTFRFDVTELVMASRFCSDLDDLILLRAPLL